MPIDCTTKDVKESNPDGREIILDGNPDLHKGMMNTGKGNCRVNV